MPINQIAQLQDAELRVYEMALEEPTEDFVDGPALDDSECARAMAFGMMAIEERLDLVCFGEMGIGNTTSAAALCHALYGGSAAGGPAPAPVFRAPRDSQDRSGGGRGRPPRRPSGRPPAHSGRPRWP